MHFRKPYVCSNQLDVQETNFSFAQFKESEIISLDAGWRLDGIPALDLCDLIVEVLHGNTCQCNQERGDPYTNLVRVNPQKTSNANEISWND